MRVRNKSIQSIILRDGEATTIVAPGIVEDVPEAFRAAVEENPLTELEPFGEDTIDRLVDPSELAKRKAPKGDARPPKAGGTVERNG